MRLLLSCAPASGSAFLARLRADSIRLLHVFLSPLKNSLHSMSFGMFRSCQGNEVLWSVVGTNPVDVMDALFWVKKPSELLFHYKTMLKHVALSVVMLMIWLVDLNVAITINSTPAFPFMTVSSSSARAVPPYIPQMVSFENPIRRFDSGCYQCSFPASTLAHTGRVRVGSTLAVSFVHPFSGGRSRIVPPSKTLAFVRHIAATASTKMNTCHGVSPFTIDYAMVNAI